MIKKQSVLIVDDTPPNIWVLKEALKNDCDVLTAYSGREALDIAQSKQPDLILLDVMMPEMDGYAVCVALKSIQESKSIPVIFVTALGSEEDEAMGFEVGAVDYITKPFNISLVRARVKTHLVLKQYRDELEHQTMKDGLTGINNRRCFDDVLAKEWSRMHREQKPISLILMDIDFFKPFNDKYGHLPGDDCLRKIARCLEESLHRPSDMVARYGGEEFACILPNTSAEGAYSVARTFQQAVANLNIANEKSTVCKCVTLSMGVSTTTPSDGETFTTLVKRADDLLYEAKKEGRNRIKTSG
ncbi:MAG: PleD family two-component system response regulator [Nitrospinae bacterium]|nr:PleD family two-component system response regulator [Nitrospinota bacterium]